MAGSVVAVGMVRDELDIIAATVASMLYQCDRVLIADNGSVDGTREWLFDLMGHQPRLTVVNDLETGYWQAEKMTALAIDARDELDAEWVVPFDADEIWLPRRGARIADALRVLPPHVLVATADLWDHVATSDDPPIANPVRRLQWRRPHPGALPKVALRPIDGFRIEQGNHAAVFEARDLPGTVGNLLTIRHYPYRSVEQTLRKIRNGAEAYAATDLPEHLGAHWRQWGAMTDTQIRDAFYRWHYREHPDQSLLVEGEAQPPLVHDPAPMPWAQTVAS